MNKHQEVVAFLKEFKEIATWRGIDVVPRRENNVALVQLGLTRADRKSIILALVPGNFCKGPEPDRDRPGDLWFFGETVNGNEVYIKLKIADIAGNGKIAKCLSFHKADYRLNYYCFT